MRRPNSHRFVGLTGVRLAFSGDQATKPLVNANSTALASGAPVFPGFNLVFLRDDGVTFALLGGVPWWGLSAVALGIFAWCRVAFNWALPQSVWCSYPETGKFRRDSREFEEALVTRERCFGSTR